MENTNCSIQSLQRAFNILEFLSNYPYGAALTEISVASGLSKSTTHRFLTSLADLGYVVKNSSEKYQLTLRMFEIGGRAVRALDIVETARPILDRMAEATKETVHLVVRDGNQIVYIYKRHLSAIPINMSSLVGNCSPIYCTGVGKAIFAYLPEEETPDIAQVGADVRAEFERILVAAGLPDVHVASELGRYVTGPHGCLVTTAIHEKHIYREYIGVDACAVDLMRPAMYGAYHHISVMGKLDAPKDHIYDVVGSLCENNDKFAVQRALPKIDMGDVLVIHDTGAHGYSMGYNYNGKLKSAEILLHSDGSFSMIRRAEKPRDYFATLDFSEFAKDLLS